MELLRSVPLAAFLKRDILPWASKMNAFIQAARDGCL
jgi:hypothetical protein